MITKYIYTYFRRRQLPINLGAALGTSEITCGGQLPSKYYNDL